MHEPRPNITIRLSPAAVADPDKVRIGGESPSFGPFQGTLPSIHIAPCAVCTDYREREEAA